MRNLLTARSLAKGFEQCALDFMHASPDKRTRVLFINSALLAGIASLYVFDLPPGPIWFLHTFYLVSSALMLFWYFHCRQARRERTPVTTPVERMPPVALGAPR